MADDVTLPGTGDVVAADDVGGVKYQFVKLDLGADGASSPVSGAVPVSASSLPLPTGAATSAAQTTGNASLSSIDSKLTGAATEATSLAIAASVHAEDSAHASGDHGVLMLAIRSDSDASTAADGDYTILKLDEEGRLKVSTKPASYSDITGDITAVQASISVPVAGGTVAGDVSRCSNVMIFCTGTFSTVNCTFEGSLESSGDTNWFGVQAIRSNANTIETTTGNLSAQPAYAWELSVNALKRFRVRCTARTSGTQSWRFVQGTYATEPIPGAQISGTQPVSGTVTAAGGAAHDAAVSGNPIRIAGRALTANYTTVATGDTADIAATLVGALIQKPYAIPELDFQAAGRSITNSTTAVQCRAAVASNKIYMTCLQLAHATLGAAMDFQVRDVPVASTTATISANTLVMAATYGWKVGDLVYVTTSTVTGLSAGSYYYLLTVSGANLTFSATPGGSTLAISGTSVAATLAHVVFMTQLETTALPITNIVFGSPRSTGTGLGLEICTPVAQTGKISVNICGYVAP